MSNQNYFIPGVQAQLALVSYLLSTCCWPQSVAGAANKFYIDVELMSSLSLNIAQLVVIRLDGKPNLHNKIP